LAVSKAVVEEFKCMNENANMESKKKDDVANAVIDALKELASKPNG